MTSKDDTGNTAFTDALESYLHWRNVLMSPIVDINDQAKWNEVYGKMQECKKIMNDLVTKQEKK